MSDADLNSGAAAHPPPPRDPASAQDQDSVFEWARQLAATGGAFSKLLALELRLAAGDAGRLVVARLAMVPLALLAWIGLSALGAWLAFQYTLSVTWGICVFVLVQIAALATLNIACSRWRKSLSLPATRRQLRALKGEEDNESSATEH